MKTAILPPTIDMLDFVAALPCLMTWRNSKGRITPLHYKSAPGMMKSMVPELAAKALARQHAGEPVGVAIHNLGNLTPTDLPGFTLFDTMKNPDGTSERVSVFTRPTVFNVNRAFIYAPDDADADSEGYIEITRDDLGQPLAIGCIVRGMKLTRGITLLDEYMQADVEVRKVSAPLLDEGRIATHYMPPDWAVWAASNRDKDGSGVGRGLAFLTNRWAAFEVSMSIEMTEAYFTGQDTLGLIEPMSPTLPPEVDHRGRVVRNPRDVDFRAHPAILAYARSQEDVLNQGVPADPNQPFLSRRSLEALSNLFDVFIRLSVADESGAMAEGVTFADSFIQRRDGGAVEGVTGDPVARWRVFQALAGGTVGQENADQFMATLELFDEVPTLDQIIKDPKKARVSDKKDAQFITAYHLAGWMNKDNSDALMAYAGRLDPHLYQNVVHSALTRDSELLTAPAIHKWLGSNPDQMARMMLVKAKAVGPGRRR